MLSRAAAGSGSLAAIVGAAAAAIAMWPPARRSHPLSGNLRRNFLLDSPGGKYYQTERWAFGDAYGGSMVRARAGSHAVQHERRCTSGHSLALQCSASLPACQPLFAALQRWVV